jgi:hypothetical protein
MAAIDLVKTPNLPQSFDSDERRDLKDELNRIIAALNALDARVVTLEEA